MSEILVFPYVTLVHSSVLQWRRYKYVQCFELAHVLCTYDSSQTKVGVLKGPSYNSQPPTAAAAAAAAQGHWTRIPNMYILYIYDDGVDIVIISCDNDDDYEVSVAAIMSKLFKYILVIRSAYKVSAPFASYLLVFMENQHENRIHVAVTWSRYAQCFDVVHTCIQKLDYYTIVNNFCKYCSFVSLLTML